MLPFENENVFIFVTEQKKHFHYSVFLTVCEYFPHDYVPF